MFCIIHRHFETLLIFNRYQICFILSILTFPCKLILTLKYCVFIVMYRQGPLIWNFYNLQVPLYNKIYLYRSQLLQMID